MYEQGTSWARAFETRGYQARFDLAGLGREVGCREDKREVLIGGLKKRNAETEQGEQAKKRPSSSPGS